MAFIKIVGPFALVFAVSISASDQAAAQVTTSGPSGCATVRYGPGPVAGTEANFQRFICPVGDPANDPRAAFAPGEEAQAVGLYSQATGDRSTAIGHRTVAAGANSVALGNRAQANADGGVAIGQGATVNAAAGNSVALGTGSVATQPNTVSVGTAGAERRIVNVAAGTSPTDAVNLGQLNAVAQSISGQTSAISALQTLSASQQGQIDTLFDLRSLDRRDMRQGIATALAMGAAPMPSAPGRTSYVFNLATFRGEQAIGGALMHRLNTSDPLAVTVGFSYAGNRNNGARVGVAGEF